ncbi:unnamed protein product, partial [Mesorhabditis belari]|uniref:FHA domain-containing protein n=1 Tax=Mesorhabditis belari TaxID=2138241 RepID=A0AAF3FA80_9BILA
MGRHEEMSRRDEKKRREVKDEPRSPRSSPSPKRQRESPPHRKRNDSPASRRNRSPDRRRQRSRSRSPDRRGEGSLRQASRSHRNDREERRRDDNRDRDGSSRKPQVKEEVNRDDGNNEKSKLSGDASKKKEIWGKPEHWEKPKEEEIPPEEKQKVNMGLSGKLAEDTNTFRGVVIKYNEPPEAKIPKTRWRLYPFKGDESLPTLYIHRQSAYLIGRDRVVADLAVDHPSCSKQHAVIQYRSVPFTRPDGTKGRAVRPYVIDLSSGNGTFLNGDKVDPQRYYELKERDVLKFGFSSREYVILNENSADRESDDEGGEGNSPDE